MKTYRIWYYKKLGTGMHAIIRTAQKKSALKIPKKIITTLCHIECIKK